MPQRHFNHTSIVFMAFKCHTGLDTCVTTTPGARLYTSLHKQRAPLSFVKQERSIVISREQRRAGMGTREHPPRQSSQCRACCPTCTFLSPVSLPLSPGKWFGEGQITWSQAPVIWQKITQMGQTEPAEPTGSWEWWCTGCFLSTGCTVAQKLHRLTHQTEPLKEGLQRDQRGQGNREGAARSRGGPPICRTEGMVEVGNEGRKRREAGL